MPSHWLRSGRLCIVVVVSKSVLHTIPTAHHQDIPGNNRIIVVLSRIERLAPPEEGH